MDDLEKKLLDLPRREPSADLHARIFSPGREAAGAEVVQLPWPRRRVPLWAATAASILMVAAGFVAGMMAARRGAQTGGLAGPAAPPVVQMQVIYSGPASNPFDYTRASQDFLPEPLDMNVQVKKGV